MVSTNYNIEWLLYRTKEELREMSSLSRLCATCVIYPQMLMYSKLLFGSIYLVLLHLKFQTKYLFLFLPV